MKRFLKYRQFITSIFLLLIVLITSGSKAFAQQNIIRNWRAVSVTNSELVITVDYFYNGQWGASNIVMSVAIMDSEGYYHNGDILEDETSLMAGSHTARLRLRKRNAAKSFTSVWIQLCMSAPDTVFHCKDFSYTKMWSTPVVATQPPPVMNATIRGTISGNRIANIVTQPGGRPERVELKYVYIESVPRTGNSIRARVDAHGKFSNTIEPGKTYKVYPEKFRCNPGFLTVNARPNGVYDCNFTIIGPPIDD